MDIISTNKAASAVGPYSQAIVHHNLVYTSGQLALNPDGSEDKLSEGIKIQAAKVLENLQAVLKEAKSDFDKVIKTTVYLADMEDFADFNSVYASYFGEHKPARSTFAVKTLPKNAKVEIEAIATV